ncbi:MAG: hypothetical protein HYT41_00435 [Candidatus Sungbacteria bacterium]|nr:hypothetical protein [Candidatus Sungbacteria bacterium]
MKIQGVLEVEGVQLHIHVDVPDDSRDVFVTNVPYDAQIVTRDRIRVESLAFPPAIIEALHQKGIRYLNRLLDEQWEPALDHLHEEERWEVLPVRKMYVDAALIPFRDHGPQLSGSQEFIGGKEDLLREDVRTIGLPAGVARELRDVYQVHTFGDLQHAFLHRRPELLKGRYVSEKMVRRIEEILQSRGLIEPSGENAYAKTHER